MRDDAVGLVDAIGPKVCYVAVVSRTHLGVIPLIVITGNKRWSGRHSHDLDTEMTGGVIDDVASRILSEEVGHLPARVRVYEANDSPCANELFGQPSGERDFVTRLLLWQQTLPLIAGSHSRSKRRPDGSSPYADWFDSLDAQAAAKVTTAKLRMELGNTSNVKWFAGIGEFVIDWGPGYRIYLAKDGESLIVLFGGGTKRRQPPDIDRAKALHAEYKARKMAPRVVGNAKKRKR